ncbi:MAG: hypothetical protein GTN80_08610 [Nitrososphaeria archaeon]|nr:hypothetical protein [Nitrososphaeria archaeon]NIN53228.1 hypothetical protein [Nitrososphaeria archaeon]NIQ33682.1 hypothetical protein [Nitrososphaeria archaeon]
MTSVNPLSTIFKHLNKRVTIYLKGGERYTGILAKVDNYMNLVLEETVEQKSDKTAKYGRVLIRGSNILLVKLE